MYKSSISLNDFADEIQSELEISPPVGAGALIRIINSVEQLLYSEIINEIKSAEVSVADGVASLTTINVGEGEDSVNAYDVVRVFEGRKELVYRTADDAYVMGSKASYSIADNESIVLSSKASDLITVFYKVRPLPKRVESFRIYPDVLYIPDKFSGLMESRIRGEICKIMGDDGQAAKWLNDYNTYLEDFRIFASKRAGVDV